MKHGDPISKLMTPIPVIDETILQSNINRVQDYFNKLGRPFRPHIKTHKIPAIARQQQAAGARGINCQKVTEAEVFVDAGFEDVLLTYNVFGDEKLERLKALNNRTKLTVVADNKMTVTELSNAFDAEKPLRVLVECDTGGGRNGVQSPAEAVSLAKEIHSKPGLIFEGLMTYPKAATEADVEAFFAKTKARLTENQIACPTLSHAGTPSLFDAHLVPSATEHRAGTYIYNDRMMMAAGHCDIEDCAMHVLATIISRPNSNRAVLDSGSKALTSDLGSLEGYGLILEYPEAQITGLSEEHAVVNLSACAQKPEIGERVRIIPNHTCVVSNLFDEMVFHENGIVTRIEQVAARGKVW